MFRFQKTVIQEGESYQFLLSRDEEPLRYKYFISLLQDSESFRSFYINLLKEEIPFKAYQWETPPVTRDNYDRRFEFVVYKSPGIDLPADPGPFRSYFRNLQLGEQVAVFDNLGGDARLVAPVPVRPSNNYSHIGVFTESAPLDQQHVLWKETGRVTEKMLSNRPLWLNTAGGGVAWLHIRLDSIPKYYRHRPYARDAQG
ncbi:hypothetical protein G3570_14560 [Balneolaceae bacterium YR4-1]|uniref:Uncharacterized protein n=1 Tax=Halalkalibaculum roseum TaxID=2709311 RepID=A0A6M1T4Z2_9BACT|nr:hypothetical protein [Halalkalibaculum roseum]NGP77867.1 hypothetical protein [Halalkalibaculum roseum]